MEMTKRCSGLQHFAREVVKVELLLRSLRSGWFLPPSPAGGMAGTCRSKWPSLPIASLFVTGAFRDVVVAVFFKF